MVQKFLGFIIYLFHSNNFVISIYLLLILIFLKNLGSHFRIVSMVHKPQFHVNICAYLKLTAIFLVQFCSFFTVVLAVAIITSITARFCLSFQTLLTTIVGSWTFNILSKYIVRLFSFYPLKGLFNRNQLNCIHFRCLPISYRNYGNHHQYFHCNMTCFFRPCNNDPGTGSYWI